MSARLSAHCSITDAATSQTQLHHMDPRRLNHVLLRQRLRNTGACWQAMQSCKATWHQAEVQIYVAADEAAQPCIYVFVEYVSSPRFRCVQS